MKKLLKGTLIVAATAAVAVGAALAYFSDTEVSTDNSFVAGLVDLKVSSAGYWEGPTGIGAMTWEAKDLLPEDKFFNFTDLKPGDWGENTIDLIVESNPVWACATLTLTSNEENDLVEPEADADDTTVSDPVDADVFDGELAQNLHVIWWADDGDNVIEDDEYALPQGHIQGKLYDLVNILGWGLPNQLPLTLADSTMNFYSPDSGIPSTPLNPSTPYYVGVGWCFGDMNISPVVQGANNSPMEDPGFTCSGASSSLNVAQTDSLTADIEFYVVQYRNNEQFICPERADDDVQPQT